MLMSFKRIKHFFNKIINVNQLQLCARIIYLNWKIVGNIVAKCGNRRVIVRSAPLAEKIREAINQDFGACLFCIVKKEFFPSQLGFSIFRICKTAG